MTLVQGISPIHIDFLRHNHIIEDHNNVSEHIFTFNSIIRNYHDESL